MSKEFGHAEIKGFCRGAHKAIREYPSTEALLIDFLEFIENKAAEPKLNTQCEFCEETILGEVVKMGEKFFCYRCAVLKMGHKNTRLDSIDTATLLKFHEQPQWLKDFNKWCADYLSDSGLNIETVAAKRATKRHNLILIRELPDLIVKYRKAGKKVTIIIYDPEIAE